MRNFSELNINEGGNPVSRSAPSAEMIEAFEQHFGLKLPPEYLALLEFSNGGHPELDEFEYFNGDEAETWSVSSFFHLDNDVHSLKNLWRETEVWQRKLGQSSLPFAIDGGGNAFYLDLSTSPARVMVCVHDEDFDSLDLASSLEEFVDGLRLPEY